MIEHITVMTTLNVLISYTHKLDMALSRVGSSKTVPHAGFCPDFG